MSTQNNKKLAIIGGGASGLMAAGTALLYGADVTVFEHNKKAGRKLLITGKGRCNVTNNCSPAEFLQSVISNPRFLYSALFTFTPEDTIALIENHGTPLKTERGKRVFPTSDLAGDVLSALLRYAKGTRFIHEHVNSIKYINTDQVSIETPNEKYVFDAVILATGGTSYPKTGSDGTGFEIAKALGHSITPLQASLVPLIGSNECEAMQGLSLKNVGVTITDTNNKQVYTDFGELLFTHFGISGPTILSGSAHLTAADITGYVLHIDLKPALDEATLDTRLLGDFQKYQNRELCNALNDLLPQKMIPVFIQKTNISPHKKINCLTKSERLCILRTLKDFTITLKGRRPIDEAIITRGGISVKEIDPKTMASKLIPKVFFAGEMIDVDAYTGGFNLQIAFSTGYLAGKHAAEILY